VSGEPLQDAADAKLALLCSDGPSSRAVYNALKSRFGPVPVIRETGLDRRGMALRRVSTLGFGRVIGQAAFVGIVVPLLKLAAGRRITAIRAEHSLGDSWDGADIVDVATVNSEAGREALRNLAPSVVVVNGTRIIEKATLDCVEAPFINTHAGITPLYRGVHGGYWALAEGRRELAGTTVHLVDAGIDTGTVLGRAFFEPTPSDNFATYPYLHTAVGIPVLLAAVERALQGDLTPLSEDLELASKFRSHPTIVEYFSNRVRRGVR